MGSRIGRKKISLYGVTPTGGNFDISLDNGIFRVPSKNLKAQCETTTHKAQAYPGYTPKPIPQGTLNNFSILTKTYRPSLKGYVMAKTPNRVFK